MNLHEGWVITSKKNQLDWEFDAVLVYRDKKTAEAAKTKGEIVRRVTVFVGEVK